MAIIKSLAVGKAKGSMQNITYRCLGGDTIGQGKVAFPSIPRTNRQMALRVKWANLVNVWQALEGVWHPSFEQAVGRVSDFNLFMSRNLTGSAGVYLTSSQAKANASVAAAYCVTEGSLVSIDSQIANGVLKSDISIGDLAIDEETTVADFSNAVVRNNSDWAYGDQISFISLEQRVDSVTGKPYVFARMEELTLNGDRDDELLADVVSPEAFSVVDNKISTGASVQGAAAYIHSRYQNGKTLVSTQSLVAANSILAQYQSDTAKNEAIISYGGKVTNEFLTPEIDVTL